MEEQAKGKVDNDILFSKYVKAGKRVYYIDVKQDRHGELYLSLTESKRLKDTGDGEKPIYEKHKIFLYREDLERFMESFQAAAAFAEKKAPNVKRRYSHSSPAPYIGDGQSSDTVIFNNEEYEAEGEREEDGGKEEQKDSQPNGFNLDFNF